MILLRNNTSEIVLYENDIVFMGNNIPIGAVSKIDNNLIYVKLFSNKDFMYDAMVSRVEYDKTNNTVAKDITNDNDYIEIKLTGDGLYSATFQLDSNIKVNMGDEIYLKHNKYPIGKITYSKELDKENNNKYYVDLYYKNNYNKDFYVIK
ncbi:MAG: hypothetical protein QM532_00835 [Cyanobium sp. MAG06]|nr:hypothetical protein [Cyanobium sp. MAG06]